MSLFSPSKSTRRRVKKHQPTTVPKEIYRLYFNQFDVALYFGSALDLPSDALVNPTSQNISNKGTFGRAMIQAAGVTVEKEIRDIVTKRKLRIGECEVTSAGALPFDQIIHVAKPTPHFGEMNELDKRNLETCIDNLLNRLSQMNVRTVTMPPVACGNHGFPFEVAAPCHVNAFERFDNKANISVKQINIVVIKQAEYLGFGNAFYSRLSSQEAPKTPILILEEAEAEPDSIFAPASARSSLTVTLDLHQRQKRLTDRLSRPKSIDEKRTPRQSFLNPQVKLTKPKPLKTFRKPATPIVKCKSDLVEYEDSDRPSSQNSLQPIRQSLAPSSGPQQSARPRIQPSTARSKMPATVSTFKDFHIGQQQQPKKAKVVPKPRLSIVPPPPVPVHVHLSAPVSPKGSNDDFPVIKGRDDLDFPVLAVRPDIEGLEEEDKVQVPTTRPGPPQKSVTIKDTVKPKAFDPKSPPKKSTTMEPSDIQTPLISEPATPADL